MNYFIGDDSRYDRDIEGGPSIIKQATRTKVKRRKPSANNARDKKKAGSTSGLTSMIVFTSILIVLIIAVAILAALFVNERTKSTDKKSEPLNKNSSSVSSSTTKIISTPKEKSTKMTTSTAQETKVKTTQKATSAISFTSLFPLSVMSSKTSTVLLQPTTATSSIQKWTTTGVFNKLPQTSIPETSTESSMPITTPTLKSSTTTINKTTPERTTLTMKSTPLSSTVKEEDKTFHEFLSSKVIQTTKGLKITDLTPVMTKEQLSTLNIGKIIEISTSPSLSRTDETYTSSSVTSPTEKAVITTDQSLKSSAINSNKLLSTLNILSTTDAREGTTSISAITMKISTAEFLRDTKEMPLLSNSPTSGKFSVSSEVFKTTISAPTKILTKNTLSSNEADQTTSEYSTRKSEMASITPQIIATEVAADDLTSPLTSSEAASDMPEITTKEENSISTTIGNLKTSPLASSTGETTSVQTSFETEDSTDKLQTITKGITTPDFISTALATTSSIFTENSSLPIGSYGTSFTLVFVANHPDAAGYKKILCMISNDPVSINISTSPNLDPAIKSGIDRSIILNTSVCIELPYAIELDYAKIEEKVVFIQASDPVSVKIFDSHPYTSDGTLVIPLHRLSTDYIVISTNPSSSTLHYASQFGIASVYDGTEIMISLKISENEPLYFNGQMYVDDNSTINLTMNKYDSFLLGHIRDITGTKIHSSKPVAIFSGNRCTNIGVGACNILLEQMPPISSLDKIYVVPPFVNTSGGFVRIISDKTSNIMQYLGGHTSNYVLEKMKYHDISTSDTDILIIVSDNDIYVASFCNGSQNNDPFMTMIPGNNQYLPYYKLYVPDKYIENYLAIMMQENSTNNFQINGTAIQSTAIVYQHEIFFQNNTFSVLILSVTSGELTLSRIDNLSFGLIVYGFRSYDGYGFAGNILKRLDTQS